VYREKGSKRGCHAAGGDEVSWRRLWRPRRGRKKQDGIFENRLAGRDIELSVRED